MKDNRNLSTCNNTVILEGYVKEEPKLHHSSYGEGIYEMIISIPRLTAEVTDDIIIEVSERLMDLDTLKIGKVIRVEGQFRSFNKRDEYSKVHLRLAVFAKEVTLIESTEGVNEIRLDGFLCKNATYRKTPRGREICDMLVASHRSYGKSDYIPCIAWGRNARFTSNLDVGCGVSIKGRVQSRMYKKKISEDVIEDRVAYEVSISEVSVFQEARGVNTFETEDVVESAEE